MADGAEKMVEMTLGSGELTIELPGQADAADFWTIHEKLQSPMLAT